MINVSKTAQCTKREEREGISWSANLPGPMGETFEGLEKGAVSVCLSGRVVVVDGTQTVLLASTGPARGRGEGLRGSAWPGPVGYGLCVGNSSGTGGQN
jgi:hypothetical protein